MPTPATVRTAGVHPTPLYANRHLKLLNDLRREADVLTGRLEEGRS
jgi:hypothetical protein